MKKLFALAVVASIVASSIGCGGATSAAKTPAGSGSGPASAGAPK